MLQKLVDKIREIIVHIIQRTAQTPNESIVRHRKHFCQVDSIIIYKYNHDNMVERGEDRSKFSAKITTGIGQGLRVADDATSHPSFRYGSRVLSVSLLAFQGIYSSISPSDLKTAVATIAAGIFAKNILSNARRRFSGDNTVNSSVQKPQEE